MIFFDVRDELTVQNGLIFKEESCNTDIFEIRYDQAYSHSNFCPSISLDQLQALTMDDSVFREILEFPSVVSFRKYDMLNISAWNPSLMDSSLANKDFQNSTTYA
jgi:hypothetical protein